MIQMYKRHPTQLIKNMSFKVHKMLNDPRVKARVEENVTVDRKYDVPFIAGYSNDAKTIYIDRHFDSMWGKIDVTPYLLIHEKTEKALLDYYGLTYQQAHHLATHNERMHVLADGLDWRKYSDHYSPYVKSLEDEHLSKIPPDLDLQPYKDEHDHNYEKLLALQNKEIKFSKVKLRV